MHFENDDISFQSEDPIIKRKKETKEGRKEGRRGLVSKFKSLEK